MRQRHSGNHARPGPRRLAVFGALLASLAFMSAAPSRAESTAGQPSEFGSFLAGRHAAVLRDMTSATRFMLRVVEENPDNQKLTRKSFLLALGAGMMGSAADMARRIESSGGKMPMALLFLAVESARLGDLQESLRRLNDIPRTGLAVYSAPLVTAWVQAGLGDFDAALKALSPLNEKSGFLTLHNLHAGLILDLAGTPELAEARFRKAAPDLTTAPVRVVRAVGSLMEREGRVEEARTLYSDYLKANSNNLIIKNELSRLTSGTAPARLVDNPAQGVAEALFHISSALPRQRAGDFALVYAQIARHLRPELALNTLLIGSLHESRKRYVDANRVYETIDLESPYGWTTRLRIADNLDAMDRKDEAIAVLREMTAQNPTRIDAIFKLAGVLRMAEKYADAVSAYDEAFKHLGAIKARHWLFFYHRGIALERSKQWDRAEADLLKALELQPEQPYVLNYLGYSWVERGKNLEQAQKMIGRAVALRANDGFIVDSLGWVLYQVGKYEEAVKQLERAVRLRPQDPVINDHLGDAYWRVGRRQEARFQWRRSLGLEPELKYMRSTETKLENGLDAPKPVGSGG
ncbi:MAG: tetratricopeptide repeat protein [Rhodospirillaceae bacterium]|jgi:tetratricopeptide (TPR) repeat protein|nr:tetratricopeptide repeat protein [Rhodospirillaceae bacterium]MBT5665914.1 tetratricopeptide repeat protein [Rhodospirillaceae bacterium]MBT5810720.1 tetratricopeptide repeat protein [Rhodospirillaceae bacterium]